MNSGKNTIHLNQDKEFFEIALMKSFPDYSHIQELNRANYNKSKLWTFISNNSKFIIKIVGSPFELKDIELYNYIIRNNHKNICDILDCGIWENKVYIISKFFENGTLEDNAKDSNKLFFDYTNITLDLFNLVCDLNEGLHYVHNDLRIVHNDIKAENIFVSTYKNVFQYKIGDFDTNTKMYLDKTFLTSNSFRGTIPNMAPEQLYSLRIPYNDQIFYKLSDKTDYYAFGMMLYRVLYKKNYYSGKSYDIIDKKFTDDTVSLPDNTDNSIKILLKGLTMRNQLSRYGYKEVNAWISDNKCHLQ